MIQEKPSILVVDDSPLVIKIIQRLLEQHGYHVVAAEDGREALEFFSEQAFSLAILDIELPDMSGFDVAEQLRALDDDLYIPILFLSADTERTTRIRGLRHGGAVYMTKPFNDDEFIAQVESLVKLKELQENLAQKNRLLEEMCRRDSLTSLYNHSYFQEIADHEFRRTMRYGHDLSCILLDIDDFKRINDTFGHPTGDRVLAGIGEILLASVREVDVVARYGGEEFALLLPMTKVREAKMVAERVRTAIAGKVFDASRRKLRLTASLGIATLHVHHPANSLELIEFSDRALYAAKKNGKNRSYLHVPSGVNNDAAQTAFEEKVVLGA